MLIDWIRDYVREQDRTLGSVSPWDRTPIVDTLWDVAAHDRQMSAFGNGRSGANGSHFVTDFDKDASHASGRRFRIESLNDNMPRVTAIANHYKYEDVFRGSWKIMHGPTMLGSQ